MSLLWLIPLHISMSPSETPITIADGLPFSNLLPRLQRQWQLHPNKVLGGVGDTLTPFLGHARGAATWLSPIKPGVGVPVSASTLLLPR